MIQVKVAGRSGEAAARGAGPKEKKTIQMEILREHVDDGGCKVNLSASIDCYQSSGRLCTEPSTSNSSSMGPAPYFHHGE